MVPVEDKILSDYEFTTQDIETAISELDPYSAAPDDDISAKILCECKSTLATPLWLLWDTSFNDGTIPHELKLQFITPLFKKGNETEAANYRPVSITSHIIKIFERVFRNKLVDYLESSNILLDNQHGFRKKRICLTQLLEHVDSILKSLNSGNEIDVIYLDYSKAFDKVDHKVLLAKMKRYGITGKFYNWIEEFLSDRLQTVVVEGTNLLSRTLKVEYHRAQFLDLSYLSSISLTWYLNWRPPKPLHLLMTLNSLKQF